MSRAIWAPVFVGVVLTAGASEPAPSAGTAAPAPPTPRVVGQWIWTARDRQLFERMVAEHPPLSASVLVGSVSCSATELQMRRGLSPDTAGVTPRALIVRLEDSVNHCLEREPERTARRLDDLLSRLLAEVRATRTRFSELQLDYDAPSAKLERYATLLQYLKRHSLRGLEVWVTSIPAHVVRAGYGDLLRGHVAGHVLQLFDTGLECDARRADELRRALAAQRLPFRLGFGAFERRGAPAWRAHECWLGLAAPWQADPFAAGFWIFPAGIDYAHSLARLEAAP